MDYSKEEITDRFNKTKAEFYKDCNNPATSCTVERGIYFYANKLRYVARLSGKHIKTCFTLQGAQQARAAAILKQTEQKRLLDIEKAELKQMLAFGKAKQKRQDSLKKQNNAMRSRIIKIRMTETKLAEQKAELRALIQINLTHLED